MDFDDNSRRSNGRQALREKGLSVTEPLERRVSIADLIGDKVLRRAGLVSFDDRTWTESRIERTRNRHSPPDCCRRSTLLLLGRELLPSPAEADDLLHRQYASVGAAAIRALAAAPESPVALRSTRGGHRSATLERSA